MLPTEIRDKLMAGELTPDQARAMFEEARASKAIEHKPIHPMPLKPQPEMRQMTDRAQLAIIRPDLGRHLAQEDAVHYYKREMVAERTRHAVGLLAYGLIGVVDGLLDSLGYGVSEIAEDITYGVTRTIYRAGDGIRRGKL